MGQVCQGSRSTGSLHQSVYSLRSFQGILHHFQLIPQLERPKKQLYLGQQARLSQVDGKRASCRLLPGFPWPAEERVQG